MINKDSLVNTVKNANFDILLTVGAGDICNSLPAIVEALTADVK